MMRREVASRHAHEGQALIVLPCTAPLFAVRMYALKGRS